MTDTLKPCPFCGSAGKLERKTGSWGYSPGNYWCHCPSCGAKTKGFDDERFDARKGMINITKEAIAHAIEAWNRRTP
jgi:Lar family restriction alleviation protein